MQRLSASQNLNILLVDDNLDHSRGIKQLLEMETGHRVISICTSGEDAIRTAKKTSPDLILVDMNMPEMDGLTTIQKLLEVNNTFNIITLTGYDDSDLIFRAMKVGARGYILKTMVVSQLMDAIEHVRAGKVYLPTNLATKFFDHFHVETARQVSQDVPQQDNLLKHLTQREEEVLALLTNGVTYKGVAKQLFISETTVKTHVNNIFQKLQVNDRTQAVLYAIKHGLLDQTTVKAAV